MATVKFKNGDDYLFRISKLEALTRDEVCGKAIYGAANIVADEIRAELKKVPTEERNDTFWGELIGPKKAQKAGLYNSLGIAKMQDRGGFLNVKIGFDGYNTLRSKRWPKGQPNQMVARSVHNGTSFMRANPFVKKAVAHSRKRALEQMKASVDESIEKIMKG